MMNTSTTMAAALLALALGPPGALAADPVPADKLPVPAAIETLPAFVAGATAAGESGAADEARLESSRGGDAAMSSEANLSGVVTSNTAVNVVTGANSINSGSFANATGLPMVIQNSGANVLIQNATVINLQLR